MWCAAENVRMVRLTSVCGSFAARVMAARLESEGIDVKLAGCIDSPYQFTVGEMGRVDVYVSEDDLADARVVLLVDEVDATLDLPPQKDAPAGNGRRSLLALVSLVLMAAVPATDLLLS